MNTYTRTVYQYAGKAKGWVLLFIDSFQSHAPVMGYPLPVPSAQGPTASTTVAGHNGVGYLWEVWWEKNYGTWGAGYSWRKVASGGNW